MKTLAHEFKDYRMNVMSSAAGDTQVIECRRSFFAGALSAITLLGECKSGTHDSILHDLRILCQELEDFGKRGGV